MAEFFSVADEVFAEDGAFDGMISGSPAQKSLGRLYEQWKKCRKQIDPDFDSKRWRQTR